MEFTSFTGSCQCPLHVRSDFKILHRKDLLATSSTVTLYWIVGSSWDARWPNGLTRWTPDQAVRVPSLTGTLRCVFVGLFQCVVKMSRSIQIQTSSFDGGVSFPLSFTFLLSITNIQKTDAVGSSSFTTINHLEFFSCRFQLQQQGFRGIGVYYCRHCNTGLATNTTLVLT